MQGVLPTAATVGVKTVRMIFKTHLDVGYTDLPHRVIRQYVDGFLPDALRLASRSRTDTPGERYIWTTGAWLIYHALEQGTRSLRRQIESAIEHGDLSWHAAPFTTHTELADASLLRAGIEFSHRLDARFGKKTIAAKMTDVPGHTIGLVSVLADAGVRFLHLGVNEGSMSPSTPGVFRWRDAQGHELIVMYHPTYGGPAVLPGGRQAVVLNMTLDNIGPDEPAAIVALYDSARSRYPSADVVAGNLNDVADDLLSHCDEMPVVTSEIGDTWIHGVGTDPAMVQRCRALSRLRRQWIKNGQLKPGDDEDLAFAEQLLLVVEHTWGMDVKKYLADWEYWDCADLQWRRTLQPYHLIEESWDLKRQYIDRALLALRPALRREALDVLADSEVVPTFAGTPGRLDIENESIHVGIDTATGGITQLLHKPTGRRWADAAHPLFAFRYETFGAATYNRYIAEYIRCKDDWVYFDFGKPRLSATKATEATFGTRLLSTHFARDGDVQLLTSTLELDGRPDGTPAELWLSVCLCDGSDAVDIAAGWRGKPAVRMPEAWWLDLLPDDRGGDGRWLLNKLGQTVSPRSVVPGGALAHHAVDEWVRYETRDNWLQCVTLDSPLVSVGRVPLLSKIQKPDESNGLGFNLFNNLWGTNFRMWYDEDASFRYRLSFG